MEAKSTGSRFTSSGSESSQRWAQVRSTFERLLELGSDHRRQELDLLRQTDSDLAEEVESLFAHDAEGFLEQSPVRQWGSSKAHEGLRLGSFTLVRRIGTGGMGEVWEAMQDAPARRVAVKILLDRAEFGDSHERARFDLEAEVLSRLEHPNIAQIFGAGSQRLGDGSELAWIAMELVHDSQDLLSWNNRNGLDLSAQLSLFLVLCDAVQHGHQRGVLHRDIKPANILVSGEARTPVLKLIDFGIARLADADASVEKRTRTGEFLGTLAYMAPEQLERSRVHDIRADVYALGVVLYRLLTGEYPIQHEETDLPRILRRLATAEPTPLSAHLPQFAGELEWLLAKALERDPRSRYSSVDELSKDIRRYLTQRPILAGPQSRWRSTRKFVRRNRLVCGMAAVITLVLVVSMVLITAALLEARQQAQVAQKEVAKNSVVQELIESLFMGVSPSRSGRDVRVLDLLDGFSADFDPNQYGAEVEFRFRTTLGGLYHALSSFEQARVQLRAALALAQGEGDFDVETLIQAQSLLGSTLRYTGDMEEGQALLDSALRLAMEHGQPGIELDVRLLGLRQIERSGEYEQLLKQAEFIEDLARATDNESALRKALSYRGIALMGQGRVEEGLKVTKEHYELMKKSFGEDGSLTVRTFANLAVGVNTVRGGPEGEAILLRAAKDCERVLGKEADQTLTSYNNYAAALMERGKSEQAVAILERLVNTYDAMEAPPVVSRLRTLNNLGMTHRNAGRYEEAEPFLKRVLEDAERTFPEEDWNLAIFRLNYGSCLAHLGRLDEGEDDLLRAWDVLRFSEDAFGVRHKALRTIAKAYELAGRTEDARFWRQILAEDPAWQDASQGR